MNEDMVVKFEHFDSDQLWVMLVCFKSPARTVLYTYAFEALTRSDPARAKKWSDRQTTRSVVSA